MIFDMPIGNGRFLITLQVSFIGFGDRSESYKIYGHC